MIKPLSFKTVGINPNDTFHKMRLLKNFGTDIGLMSAICDAYDYDEEIMLIDPPVNGCGKIPMFKYKEED